MYHVQSPRQAGGNKAIFLAYTEPPGDRSGMVCRVEHGVELKGLRIGYPPKTSAILTIHEILKSAHLAMADINHVRLKPTELEGSLRDGKVDAVIIWDPYAQAILDAIPGAIAIIGTNTFTSFVIDLDFVTQSPEPMHAFLAAVIRASRWLKQ